MPKLTWGDALASAVVSDTYAYVLPQSVNKNDAPSKISIEGYGDLKLERQRISVYGNEALRIVDDVERKPLHVKIAPPAPGAAPQAVKKEPWFSSVQLFGACLAGALMGIGAAIGNIPAMVIGVVAWFVLLVNGTDIGTTKEGALVLPKENVPTPAPAPA